MKWKRILVSAALAAIVVAPATSDEFSMRLSSGCGLDSSWIVAEGGGQTVPMLTSTYAFSINVPSGTEVTAAVQPLCDTIAEPEEQICSKHVASGTLTPAWCSSMCTFSGVIVPACLDACVEDTTSGCQLAAENLEAYCASASREIFSAEPTPAAAGAVVQVECNNPPQPG